MRIFILVILFFFVFATGALAIENPIAVSNNKFGIHIIDENDLTKARELVNSSGGDYGYVTVVIREDERSYERWQEVFNKMRRMHLIPIVRIATKQTSDGWAKPKDEEINNWVAFLNSLNWVVKNRYVVVSNETNLAHEWGGEVKPQEYASYLRKFSDKLKTASGDFFVLPAGLDASAKKTKSSMVEEEYIKEMLKVDPEIFSKIDGWTSHSYPNPKLKIDQQFGKNTLRTYQWELELLKKLNINKDFPVFITETGWQHESDEDVSKIGPSMKEAYEKVWNDNKVVAVTPFVLNYQGEPFTKFSWIRPDGSPHMFFNDAQTISKTRGNPLQITDGKIRGYISLPIVQAGHGTLGIMVVENTGQSIWNRDELGIENGLLLEHPDIEPGEDKILFFKFNTPADPGIYTQRIQLKLRGVGFGNAPELTVRVVKNLPILGNLLPK